MTECSYFRVIGCWECPVCGRQNAVCEGEESGYKGRPYVCCDGHRQVEMEQKTPEAFRTENQ